MIHINAGTFRVDMSLCGNIVTGGRGGGGGYKGGETKNKVPAYDAVSLALNTTLQYADRLSDSSAMPPLQAGPLASHTPTNLRFWVSLCGDTEYHRSTSAAVDNCMESKQLSGSPAKKIERKQTHMMNTT